MVKKRGGKKKLVSKRVLIYCLYFLILLNLVLGGLNLARGKGWFIPGQSKPLMVDGMVDLNDLTLQQKIAQMVVVLGIEYYADALKKMQIGGIHLHAMNSEEEFSKVINSFQNEVSIPFMVTADLEGCVNPFASFKEFKALGKVYSLGEAFEKGKEHGKYLKRMGFTVDFSPVVDLDDDIWKCRSFPGDEEKVSELAQAYILGIQDEGILATAKHYPGKTLVIKDPHKFLAAAEIEEKDLYPYRSLAGKESMVGAIMVSHLITYGEVNSEGKPSVVSKKIIDGLREYYDGLIITDEINMLGLKNFYDSDDEMYVEVFKAGSDIVLNFNNDPNELYHMILVVEEAVKRGEISEEAIDNSVRKILEMKGLKVR